MDVVLRCIRCPSGRKKPREIRLTLPLPPAFPQEEDVKKSRNLSWSLIVGREGADVSLGSSPLPCCSRRHASISYDADTEKVSLKDLNSSNGTFVNGKRASEITLQDQDEVIFGGGQSVPVGGAMTPEQVGHPWLSVWKVQLVPNLSPFTGGGTPENYSNRKKKKMFDDKMDKVSSSTLLRDPTLHLKSVPYDLCLKEEGKNLEKKIKSEYHLPFKASTRDKTPQAEKTNLTSSENVTPIASTQKKEKEKKTYGIKASPLNRTEEDPGFSSSILLAGYKTPNSPFNAQASPSEGEEKVWDGKLGPKRLFTLEEEKKRKGEDLSHAPNHTTHSPEEGKKNNFSHRITPHNIDSSSTERASETSAIVKSSPSSCPLQEDPSTDPKLFPPLVYYPEKFDEIMPRTVRSTQIGNFRTTKVQELHFDPLSWRWVQLSPNPSEEGEYISLRLRLDNLVYFHYYLPAPECEGIRGGSFASLRVFLSKPLERVQPTVFALASSIEEPPDLNTPTIRRQLPSIVFTFKQHSDLARFLTDLRENYVGDDLADRFLPSPAYGE